MFIRDKFISPERMLHKYYDSKGSVAKEKSLVMIGGKPPVVK
jgi:hypothetical protein